MEKMNKNKVFVGMSGGVDSSVSAFLLKQAGFDVTGVFIKVWRPEFIDCSWKDDRRDAMRVCAHLNIPFLTINLEEEYKKFVVDYMISEYKAGRTPNPDVMCNRYIKFGSFAKKSKELGADYVATGHYARNILNTSSGKKNGVERFELFEGADKNKDQSYFLWTLNQNDLVMTKFPVGHLEKTEVRKIAEKAKLPVFDKKDSQGLCFMGKVDLKDFLKKYINTKKGSVLDINGKIIGEHDGSELYTIGERHGFKIFNQDTDAEPMHIVDKDLIKNTITVIKQSEFHAKNSAKNIINITNINWALGIEPKENKEYLSRSRYRQKPQVCTLRKTDKKNNNSDMPEWQIKFKESQDTLTPGQSLVIYEGEKCLGGGIIV